MSSLVFLLINFVSLAFGATVWPANITVSGFDGRFGVLLELPDSFSRIFYESAGLGNFDGTPPNDIAIGSASSCVYVVPGSSARWPPTISLTPSFCDEQSTEAGLPVKPAGDVDGDGRADVMIGAQQAHNAVLPNGTVPPATGSAWVVMGNHNNSNLSQCQDGVSGFRVDGIAVASGYMGELVANVGDVNGDSHDDFVFGGGGIEKLYLVWGRPAGPWPSGIIRTSEWIEGDIGISIDSEAPGDRMGMSRLATHAGGGGGGGGDVTGDGIDDLLIGAPGNTNAAYVIFGHRGAWGKVNLSNLDGHNGVKFLGGSTRFGSALGIIGDVNHDGIADIAILDQPLFPTVNHSAICVAFGRNGTWPAVFTQSMFDGHQHGFRLLSPEGNKMTNNYASVAGVDINDDGFTDICIGSGKQLFVVFGHSKPWAAASTVDNLADGTTGFRVKGEAFAWAVVSHLVSAAGDVNGDGIEDLVVGTLCYGATLGSPVHPFIIFGNIAPTIVVNRLSISRGETIKLAEVSDISVSDNRFVEDVQLTASNIEHGTFVVGGTNVTSFTVAQLRSGEVQFQHDGSSIIPAYSLVANDGQLSSGQSVATVSFTTSCATAPVLSSIAIIILSFIVSFIANH